MKLDIEIFVVRNQEGQWFRAKGYGGGGDSWVDDLSNAKFYGKIGTARSRVTFFAKNYPEFGVPDIIKISAVEAEVIDQKERVAKAINRQKRAKAVRAASIKKRRLEMAQEELDKAEARVRSLK